MTVAELALRKITDYYEDEERSIMAKVTIEKELVPELCEANGDVLKLVFSDGTVDEFDLWDCNTDYSGAGVSHNSKDEKYAYIY